MMEMNAFIKAASLNRINESSWVLTAYLRGNSGLFSEVGKSMLSIFGLR